ncbi:methyltransferase domain-containing protein [Actinoplanes rectilineatus]|uniref:methyltransferase domain-containing protein n=1 Tax=Actinoplanes rectilineatus TaxID=113571 RepID=UPI0005F279FF|nr:methyltransferase domain-containing protein [Actinoplanes rectilineatus]
MTEWRGHAAALAADLVRAGALTPDWRAAFEQVPRHLLVPRFFDDDGEIVSGDDRDGRGRWLAAVYSDVALTTQIEDSPGTGPAWPTSSSTRPSLMARMLDLLAIAGGERVLEIGTGTGYNAALLSHRLGADRVTSVDVDSGLVDTARRRLAALKIFPHLYAEDGVHGSPGRAPYDRVIATCGVSAIPAAWIRQLSLGGVIVADVRGGISSSLVVARKTTGHAVTGRFTAEAGHFMWMRSHAMRDGGGTFDFDGPHTGTTGIPLADFGRDDFRFVLQLAIPDLAAIGGTVRDGRDGVFLVAGDRSWAEVGLPAGGRSAVAFGGPRAWWPDVADAWEWWNARGRPGIARFGFTARDDGRHTFWVDEEDGLFPRTKSVV